MNSAMLTAFLIYFLILTTIGFFFYRKQKGASSFMLDRSVNFWVTAIATQASDMGSWLFMGFPAAIYTLGIFGSWTAIGLVVCMFLNWHFIAPKLRTTTEQYKSSTLSSYFDSRFHSTNDNLRTVSAFISIYFFIFYIAANIKGLGLLFKSAFNISFEVGALIGLTTCALYTLIGGFIAVAWCDFFQGLFLLAAIIFVPAYAYATVGSIPALSSVFSLKHIATELFPSLAKTGEGLLMAFGWGLGYFGQPHILVNFMGIDDPKKIRQAKYVGITWQIIVLLAAICLGLIGKSYFSNGIADTQLIFITMTKDLFFPLLAGFILCAILAAVLSTMDSHILIAGSTIAQDLYQKSYHRTASSSQVLFITRVASIVISFISLIIAITNTTDIFTLVYYAWAGLGASFAPLILAALYTTKVDERGALAGLCTGAFTVAIWPLFWPLLGASISPLTPAFLLSGLALFIFSGKQ